MEDAGVFGKEAENQPRHEVIEIMSAIRRVPVRVFPEQLDIELVQASGGLDVESVFANLFDRGDSCQRQKKTEVIGKIGVVADERFAISEVFRFQSFAIGGEDELCFGARRLRAVAQCVQRFGNATIFANSEMDIIALKNAAGQIGLIRIAAAKPLERGLLVAKRFEEGERKIHRVKRGFGELGNGFFDFDSVHVIIRIWKM